MHAIEIIQKRVSELDAKYLRRKLLITRGRDFTSNDYLGLSCDQNLKEKIHSRLLDFPAGSGGSRLLRGHSELFEKVEERLAQFVGRGAALIFPSGYQANVALFSSLLKEGDVVFSDEFNHASLIDGIRLTKAKRVIFKHNDSRHLEDLLKKESRSQGLKIIATESLFSMDGDLSPLKEYAELSQNHHASLIVDESHATGIFGSGGGRVRKLNLESAVLATLHTGGKALGVGGAWIAGDQILKDYLVNFARGLIYSTAPIPLVALSLDAAVLRWKEVGPKRVEDLLKCCKQFRKDLENTFYYQTLSQEAGPIVPIVLGSNKKALLIAERLQNQGFDVRALRPPTVPPGTARLRVTLTYPQLGDSLNSLLEYLLKFLEEK